MFKKVYRGKQQEDFRDNMFSVVEVTRKSPLTDKKNSNNMHNNIEEVEDTLHHFNTNDDFDCHDEDVPFFDNFDDGDDYEYEADDIFDDSYDEDVCYDSYDDMSASDFSSFADMDASAIDWSNVDFANTDWSQY